MSVLAKIKRWLEAEGEDSEAQQEHTLDLATGVLLMEVVRADHKVEPAELAALNQVLRNSLSLSSEEAEELIHSSQQAHDENVGMYEFTRAVNEHGTPELKLQLVENLWRVAYADGAASAVEEHTIRRMSELLYVPHADYIRAKQAARTEPR